MNKPFLMFYSKTRQTSTLDIAQTVEAYRDMLSTAECLAVQLLLSCHTFKH